MDDLCVRCDAQDDVTKLVGDFCFYWMMQHTDFVQFMGSLAVFR